MLVDKATLVSLRDNGVNKLRHIFDEHSGEFEYSNDPKQKYNPLRHNGSCFAVGHFGEEVNNLEYSKELKSDKLGEKSLSTLALMSNFNEENRLTIRHRLRIIYRLITDIEGYLNKSEYSTVSNMYYIGESIYALNYAINIGIFPQRYSRKIHTAILDFMKLFPVCELTQFNHWFSIAMLEYSKHSEIPTEAITYIEENIDKFADRYKKVSPNFSHVPYGTYEGVAASLLILDEDYTKTYARFMHRAAIDLTRSTIKTDEIFNGLFANRVGSSIYRIDLTQHAVFAIDYILKNDTLLREFELIENVDFINGELSTEMCIAKGFNSRSIGSSGDDDDDSFGFGSVFSSSNNYNSTNEVSNANKSSNTNKSNSNTGNSNTVSSNETNEHIYNQALSDIVSDLIDTTTDTVIDTPTDDPNTTSFTSDGYTTTTKLDDDGNILSERTTGGVPGEDGYVDYSYSNGILGEQSSAEYYSGSEGVTITDYSINNSVTGFISTSFDTHYNEKGTQLGPVDELVVDTAEAVYNLGKDIADIVRGSESQYSYMSQNYTAVVQSITTVAISSILGLPSSMIAAQTVQAAGKAAYSAGLISKSERYSIDNVSDFISITVGIAGSLETLSNLVEAKEYLTTSELALGLTISGIQAYQSIEALQSISNRFGVGLSDLSWEDIMGPDGDIGYDINGDESLLDKLDIAIVRHHNDSTSSYEPFLDPYDYFAGGNLYDIAKAGDFSYHAATSPTQYDAWNEESKNRVPFTREARIVQFGGHDMYNKGTRITKSIMPGV